MTEIEQIKKNLNVDDKKMSEIFSLKNEATYKASSAKSRYEKALINIYKLTEAYLKSV